jgi:hypothetical protein
MGAVFGDALVREVRWEVLGDPARYSWCRSWEDLNDVCDANEFLLDAADVVNVDLGSLSPEVVQAGIARVESEVLRPTADTERDWFVTVYDTPGDADYQLFLSELDALRLGLEWASVFANSATAVVSVYRDRFPAAFIGDDDWCWWDRYNDGAELELVRRFK